MLKHRPRCALAQGGGPEMLRHPKPWPRIPHCRRGGPWYGALRGGRTIGIIQTEARSGSYPLGCNLERLTRGLSATETGKRAWETNSTRALLPRQDLDQNLRRVPPFASVLRVRTAWPRWPRLSRLRGNPSLCRERGSETVPTVLAKDHDSGKERPVCRRNGSSERLARDRCR